MWDSVADGKPNESNINKRPLSPTAHNSQCPSVSKTNAVWGNNVVCDNPTTTGIPKGFKMIPIVSAAMPFGETTTEGREKKIDLFTTAAKR